MIQKLFGLIAVMSCFLTEIHAQQQYAPDYVYEIDGVEFVNSSKRNDTMQVAFTQKVSPFKSSLDLSLMSAYLNPNHILTMLIFRVQFFDNIQENLTNQLFEKIENYNFSDVIDANIGVKDIIDFTFNLTDWKVSNLKLDNKTKLMQLLDGRAIFQFSNFTGNLKGNYMYVSDPPILADIGVYEWNINSTSFKLDSSTDFNNEESLLNFTLNEIDLEIEPFKCDF